ncbi:MAG: AAA family ATPase, partial [Prochloraceae cyanobacterium]
MNTLPGYQIKELIHAGVKTLIYREIRESDRKSVIVKRLKAEYPTLEEITRIRNEYKITENLQLEGIVKSYSLQKHNNVFALILEDFGGESLNKLLDVRKLESLEFLTIAIQLAKTIGELHQNQIIHKDIKPSNIIIDPKSLKVKICDFSISTQLPRETHILSDGAWERYHPTLLEGTLAYISPEQTGRMNRSIDYRTDFYSLGVTFYEMLTGELPFKANDPLELIHYHITRLPVPPHQVNSEVPEAVSSIVIKLLAKNAEDRYQSAGGIKADLETCLTQLQKTAKIEGFTPGKLDKSSQFLIPQKLYGRSAEVAMLMSSFERVSFGGSEMMLVSGFSGIGKTSVINEIHKPIVRQRGYFINGKFDQFKRNIPYAAIVQAFQSLLRQLLTETAEKISLWQEKLLSRLGENGQVIIDVIPEVELIIGSQPTVPQLGSTESQ